jgi:circadian clock protein KaiC
MSALANRLRSLHVTTLFTEETELFTDEISTPMSDRSAVADNIIFLRHTEFESELIRCISVIKTRDSEASTCIYMYEIGPKGLELGKQLKGLSGIMTGAPSAKNGSNTKRIRKASRRKK